LENGRLYDKLQEIWNWELAIAEKNSKVFEEQNFRIEDGSHPGAAPMIMFT
jgi:hypothetical protein